jgi:hypothetical protein
VIEWDPTASDDVVNVATSLVILEVPKVVDPSENVIVPLALGKASVAVNVTLPAYTPVVGEALTVMASSEAVPAPLSDGVKKTV